MVANMTRNFQADVTQTTANPNMNPTMAVMALGKK
jgi:hypothetical protein